MGDIMTHICCTGLAHLGGGAQLDAVGGVQIQLNADQGRDLRLAATRQSRDQSAQRPLHSSPQRVGYLFVRLRAPQDPFSVIVNAYANSRSIDMPGTFRADAR